MLASHRRIVVRRLIAVALILAVGACSVPIVREPFSDTEEAIRVDQPEIYDNAYLQAQIGQLQASLSSLNTIDQPSISGAISNFQGTTTTQSGVSLQVTGPGTATIPVATAAIPAVAAPAVGLSAQGVLDRQLQLSSQIMGYQLLLAGSDFARYTPSGGAKDRIVVGFPVTIDARGHRDQAAEVEIIYYPPNAAQFDDPPRFVEPGGSALKTEPVCSSRYFSPGDPNAEIACLEQERSPTIINILPRETSYNTVGISSKSTTLGLGAVIGTVSAGASAGKAQQTEYVVAEQDTVATVGSGPLVCSPDSLVGEDGIHCVANSRGVRFSWQFRPVLGEHSVRGGPRTMYVQLAIPYARRPYPNYGGIAEIRTRWFKFNAGTGSMAGRPIEEKRFVRAVFGHPFMSPAISSVEVNDQGGGSVLVTVAGSYLIGATVRVGATVLSSSSPGFVAAYNQLQFTTTAQALAQSGAVVTSSNGVDTPLTTNDLCKYFDEYGECFRTKKQSESDRIKIRKIIVDPISASTSQVRIELCSEIKRPSYGYFRYYRQEGDVVGTAEERKPQEEQVPASSYITGQLNELPIVVALGGKVYGFSDLPLQYFFEPGEGDGTVLSLIASNDSLNTSPKLRVQRLFGDPNSDSAPVSFVPPNAVVVSPLTVAGLAKAKTKSALPRTYTAGDMVPAAATKTPKDPPASNDGAPAKKCDQEAGPCRYTLTGASADWAKLFPEGQDCSRDKNRCKVSGKITLGGANVEGHTAREIVAAKGAKQVALQFTLAPPAQNTLTEVLAVSLAGSPSAAAGDASAVTVMTQTTPNFTLSRPVATVVETDNIAYIKVDVKNLKDQSATLTVAKANIVTAIDGNGNKIGVQPGGVVTVTQDTSVTFQLRDPDNTNVNVIAEGKNGSVSTGKVTFASNFSIVQHTAKRDESAQL